MISDTDRQQMTRALAKAIAFANAGKPDEANSWAHTLFTLLGAAGVHPLRLKHRSAARDASGEVDGNR